MPTSRQEGEVVQLTPLAADDLAGVHTLWSDEEATRLTNFPFLATLEACRERLGKMLAHYGQGGAHVGPFAIRSQDGEFLGLVGGDASEVSDGSYELWYFVGRRHWRRGVARSAVQRILSMIWASRQAKTIKAEVAVENAASRALLEQMGFEQAQLLVAPRGAHGKTFDRYVYELSRPPSARET
jgi:RimJ/RimL family protein N-acetyltransferase